MGEKLVVGPVNKGLRNDVTPFNVDNDSFPNLINAYQWRGRIKRKRGTSTLGRLTLSGISVTGLTLTLNAGQSINLISALGLEANSTIKPGSINITGLTDGTTYTDPAMDGVLVATGGTGTGGSINYASGLLTITAGGGQGITGIFSYYPDLPVMGLRDFIFASTQFPNTIAFDTVYSYNINTTAPYDIYNVSFYKNPAASVSLPGYIRKAVSTPTTWNGGDYQQFWTINYQGALWATNGINVPFNPLTVGMQFNPITGVVINAAGPPAIATLTIVAHGLVQGDFVFINEVGGITGINYQTGYVISADPQAANTVQVEFPNATLGGVYTTGGIAQYITNRSDVTRDCLRFYDGDPTDGNPTNPALTGLLGWVNFAPPLSNLDFGFSDLPADQYYLIGARVIFPFKDRILFFGPVVQTSSANSQVYLQDTIIYSQNGTPYYTSSFTAPAINYPLFPTGTGYQQILVPDAQTATPSAYFEDITGFGGSIAAGLDQEILTVAPNEDVLIVGFTRLETRLVYSGNDIVPFLFFIINSELGSGSTFSVITMDKGVLTTGSRGFILTSQVEARRFDPQIPNEVFEIRRVENGTERVTAQRDYLNQWVYFTYPVNSINYKFPTQTLQYNYDNDSWAIFKESYTTYGLFRKSTGYTWGTIGTIYPTWGAWDVPWNDGVSTLLNPLVIAGNQQGFVMIRNEGTDEGNSLYIKNIVASVINSPDHCLVSGDYIVISDCLGTSSVLNGQIFRVTVVVDKDNFRTSNSIPSGITYLGNGVIKKMYVPFIQTRQFPTSWGLGRKTRIGMQQYLLSKTSNAQITLLIFLSQDSANPYNFGNIVPNTNIENSALIYSTVLYTCPESTNLGLTPANRNLQMPTAVSQEQIWHRVNTSLIGDTVQLGFTMSEAQMRDPDFKNQFEEIELHGFIIDLNQSQWLA